LKTGVVLNLTAEGYVRRRDFIKVIAGSAAAWPLAARAQQLAMPVVGFLSSGSKESDTVRLPAFWRSLNETGYVEGRNVASEYRWADDRYDSLSALAANLAERQPSVIATIGSPAAALAAKTATSTIPIVFAISGDPMLHEAVPRATMIGCLVNRLNPNFETNTKETEPRPRGQFQSTRRQCHGDNHVRDPPQTVLGRWGGGSEQTWTPTPYFEAGTERDIETAFTTFVQQQADGVVIVADALFNSRPKELVALAARHALPTIHQYREFAAAGGLISYGSSLADAYRQAGIYAGRILKGEKAGDLPVLQATKVELILNLRTAKALGITFPISLLGRADEVIQ
jgi:ABC-type uncharacterized transport system substrate-binding protein